MDYPAEGQRIHSVLVTRNTEYHMRRGRCVRVRDRESQAWLDDHKAVAKELVASLALCGDRARLNTSGNPEPGEVLYFDMPSGHLVTSPILSVERPSKQLVRHEYPPVF